MSFVIVRYLHFLGIAGLFASLAVELALFRPRVSGATARRLARIDGLFGLSALAVLVTGLMQVFVYGKSAAYYGHDFVFHIKMTLFVLIVALSVAPTARFFRARGADPESEVSFPPGTGRILRLELALLVLMPLLAVMMARGFGYRG